MQLMWLDLIPVACALIAAITALGIALQNRRWIKADREADRLRAREQRLLAARDITTRTAAMELFGFYPGSCLGLIGDGSCHDFSEAVQVISAGMCTIEPARHWAAALPVQWWLRIDGLLSLLAHTGSQSVAAQLQRDLVDLLNGQECPGPMDDENVLVFGIYMTALIGSTRYTVDPRTRGLQEAFLAMCFPTSDRVEGLDEAAELLGGVIGRRELSTKHDLFALVAA